MEKREKKFTAALCLEKLNFAYVFLFLLVYPILYHDNYIDIVRFKVACFKGATLIFMVAAIVFLVWNGIQKKKESGKFPTLDWKKKDNLFVLIFTVAVIISTILAENSDEAFWGMEGRRLGAYVMLMCLFLYLIPGAYLKVTTPLFAAFLVSNTIVFVLGSLDFWGFDILHMYDNLVPEQHVMFISTIGNINVNAGYLCLILPVAMGIYFTTEKKRAKLACAVFLCLGFYEGYATISDSFLLGIAAVYLALFWFSCTDTAKMRRFLELVALFRFASLLMGITLAIGSVAGADSPMYLFFQTLPMQKLLTSPGVLIVTGVLLASLYETCLSAEKKDARIPWRTIRKYFFLILAVLFVLAVIIVLVANGKAEGEWGGSAAVLNRLQLTDESGSNRGYVWKRIWTTFKKQSFYLKLFGCGLTGFPTFLADYTQEMLERFGAVFIDAHNEILQFLVTTGIVGVIGYYGIFFSETAACVKKAVSNPLLLTVPLAVTGFLVQGLVNNPQTFLTPSAFLMLGVFRSIKNEKID